MTGATHSILVDLLCDVKFGIDGQRKLSLLHIYLNHLSLFKIEVNSMAAA